MVRGARVYRPSTALRRLALRLDGSEVTVGEITGRLGADATVGWMLLLLAIPSLIPSPGVPIGVFIGIAMAVIAIQLICGFSPLRLPGWLSRRRLAADQVRALASRAQPLLRRLDRALKPRFAVLTGPWFLRLLGLLVLIHGILIALPIPFGNTAPGFAVLLLALGLIARDGLAVIAGFGVSAIALAVSSVLMASAVWVVEAAIGL
jgi:hypothetical protein